MENITFFAGLGIHILLSALLLSRLCSVGLYFALGIIFIALHGLFIALRWFNTGHPPILGTFEETLAAGWFLTLFSLILDRKKGLAHLTIPFASLTLLYGLIFSIEERPLIISEQSLWVYFHALFAWIAYGFYTISFAASIIILLKKQRNSAAFAYSLSGRFLYNNVLYGLIAQTIMFILGSYYSSRLHGSWWVWDPVEYLFIVSWFMYAIALHGRFFYAWKEDKIASWTVTAFVATMLLYWGLIYFPWITYHIFDPEFKIHG